MIPAEPNYRVVYTCVSYCIVVHFCNERYVPFTWLLRQLHTAEVELHGALYFEKITRVDLK